MSNRDNPGVVRTSEQSRLTRIQDLGRTHITRPASPRPRRPSQSGNPNSQFGSPSDPTTPAKPEEVSPPVTLTGPGNPGDSHRDRSAAPQSSGNTPSSPPLLMNSPDGDDGRRVLVAATPSSDSGLSYATEHSPPVEVKEEMMDDLPDNPTPGREHSSTSSDSQTMWPVGQADNQSVGSVDHTTFDDITPATWGQIRQGGDTMAQKFFADMYKFMYITNRSTIIAANSHDSFTRTNAELEIMVKAARDEATEALREVRRLSGGMAAMQKTISSMSEEISLIARHVHESSPPLKTTSAQATRPPLNTPNLPPRPKPTQRIDDQKGTGVTPPAPSTKPPPHWGQRSTYPGDTLRIH